MFIYAHLEIHRKSSVSIDADERIALLQKQLEKEIMLKNSVCYKHSLCACGETRNEKRKNNKNKKQTEIL